MFEIRPQDVLLRLPNRRLYIGPLVQEYLVGLDFELEEHLTRWTFGVQNALRSGAALPTFPTGGTAPQAGEALASSGPRVSGQVETGDGADRGTETRPPQEGIPHHRDAREFPWHSLMPSQQRLELPRLRLLARKGGRRLQEADEADREDLVGSHEQPVLELSLIHI